MKKVTELESALAAQFKQAHENNASIDGTHLNEKGSHIPLLIWKQPTFWLPMVVSADLRGGTHLTEKGLHISDHLEIANFLASSGWISRFKRRHNIAYTNLSGDSKRVDSETKED
jgi:hypothetical protein